MSIYYNDVLVIGFLVDRDSFLEPLLKECEAVTHTEERYNQKTGKRLEDVEIVDVEAGEFWVLDDVKVDTDQSADPILEEIAGRVGASITKHGDYYDGSGQLVAIEPALPERRDDGGHDLEVALAAKEELTRIERELRKLGLDPGKMGIFSCLDIY